jgi:hypothetical protein
LLYSPKNEVEIGAMQEADGMLEEAYLPGTCHNAFFVLNHSAHSLNFFQLHGV